MSIIGNPITPPAVTKMKLLWTNPSPAANFGATTITLDLSKYNAVWICYRIFNYGSEQYHMSMMFPIDSNRWALYGGSDNGRNSLRNFVFNSTGIAFENGRYNSAASNQVDIPLYIYGIKF